MRLLIHGIACSDAPRAFACVTALANCAAHSNQSCRAMYTASAPSAMALKTSAATSYASSRNHDARFVCLPHGDVGLFAQ